MIWFENYHMTEQPLMPREGKTCDELKKEYDFVDSPENHHQWREKMEMKWGCGVFG